MSLLAAIILAGWLAYCFFPAIEEGLEDRRMRKEVDAAMKKFNEEHYWDPNAGHGGEWRRKDGKPILDRSYDDAFLDYENRVRG